MFCGKLKKKIEDLRVDLAVAGKEASKYLLEVLSLRKEREELIQTNYKYSIEIENLKEELKRAKSGNRKPRAKPLSHKKGYKKVSPEEHVEFIEMFDNGIELHKIAEHFDRTVSCVGNRIRKELKERKDAGTVQKTS